MIKNVNLSFLLKQDFGSLPLKNLGGYNLYNQ